MNSLRVFFYSLRLITLYSAELTGSNSPFLVKFYDKLANNGLALVK